MRLIFGFIFGFIFFGLIYYTIWVYAPDAFQVLTAYAAKIFDFIKSALPAHSGPAAEPAKSMLLLLGLGRQL